MRATGSDARLTTQRQRTDTIRQEAPKLPGGLCKIYLCCLLAHCFHCHRRRPADAVTKRRQPACLAMRVQGVH